jgi:hypothetical protein
MSAPSPLEGLATPGGPLQREAPDAKEFTGLLKSGERRLADAQRLENSLESRFDLAYNAAHALCLAALRRAGYRSSKRYIVFQALPHTLGLGPEVWRVLDRAHSERNRSEYEGDLSVDERLLGELIKACEAVLDALRRLPRL